jgi:hypothetical protein
MNHQEELEAKNRCLNDLNGKLEWRYNLARSQYFSFLQQAIVLTREKKVYS